MNPINQTGNILLYLSPAIILALLLGRVWAKLTMTQRLKFLYRWQFCVRCIFAPLGVALGSAMLGFSIHFFRTTKFSSSDDLITGIFIFFVGLWGVMLIGTCVKTFFHLASSSPNNEPETEKGRTIGDLKGAVRALSKLGKREQSRIARSASPKPQPAPSAPPTVEKSEPEPPQSEPAPIAAEKGPEADSGPGTLAWGMLDLPESERTQHFLVAGSVGSGKTLTILMLMRSVMRRMKKGQDCRALVLDAKREYFPHIAGFHPEVKIRTFDPFDMRGVAWDIAADISTSAEADQLVHLLIPRGSNESQPYFSDAARDLTKYTIEALQKVNPLKWSLRDVLLLTENPDRLRAFLERVPAVMERARRHFDANEFPSVMSTLATKLGPLTVVAALWEKAEDRYSLNQWMEECSILLFANDPVHRESLEPLNRAIFARASNLLLSRDANPPGRTWVFLDEVRETGKLDGLRSLLNLGRSKGVGVVLGFQDFDGMRALYGNEEAHEITGQANNKTFLRTDSVATAKWMESNAGKVLVKESNISLDPSSLGLPKSVSVGRTTREAVMASEFMEIPRTTPENGLRAFHLSALLGKAYWSHTKFADVLEKAGSPHPGVPNFIARPSEFQQLEPWSAFDAAEFEIPFKAHSGPAEDQVQKTQTESENTAAPAETKEEKPSEPVESAKEAPQKADPGASNGGGDALDRLNSVKRRNDEDERPGPEGA